MSTLSPLHADAFALLRQNLYLHLDEADFLALKYDDWSEEDTGHACGTPWPCEALETIHRLVKDPEAEFVKLVRIADART